MIMARVISRRRNVEKEIVRTVCEGCMSGCGVLVHKENGKVTKIAGDPDHPQNRGRLCIKGPHRMMSFFIIRIESSIP